MNEFRQIFAQKCYVEIDMVQDVLEEQDPYVAISINVQEE